MKIGQSSSILLRCATVHYPSRKQSKYSNSQTVNPSKCVEENQKLCSYHHHHRCLYHYFVWSGPDAIINSRDPMQNLGQTRIFYKLGQTHLI